MTKKLYSLINVERYHNDISVVDSNKFIDLKGASAIKYISDGDIAHVSDLLESSSRVRQVLLYQSNTRSDSEMIAVTSGETH